MNHQFAKTNRFNGEEQIENIPGEIRIEILPKREGEIDFFAKGCHQI